MEIPYQPMSPEEEERELRRDLAELNSRRRRTFLFNFAARRELSRKIAITTERLREVRAKKKSSRKNDDR